MNRIASGVVVGLFLLSFSAPTEAQQSAASRKALESAAAKGSAAAEYSLGAAAEADGDFARAVDWYRKSAEQNYAGAEFNLGALLESGKGVDADQTQAVEWYRKAAAQGLAAAMTRLETLDPNKVISPPSVGERVILRTTRGDIMLVLVPELAPKHCFQFLRLVHAGVYDTGQIDRVQRGYYIQFDVTERLIPLTPAQNRTIGPIPGEFSKRPFKRGTVFMSRDLSDPNSARVSFAILTDDAPYLEGQYTIFGVVERGMDVLDAISRVDVDLDLHPLQRVGILRVDTVDDPEDLKRVSLVGRLDAPSEGPRAFQVGNLASVRVVWCVGVMMVLGIGTFLASGRLPPKIVGAFGLLTVLTGFFLLWITILPAAHESRSRWVAAAVFLGATAVFKLMNKFESPVAPKVAPGEEGGAAKGARMAKTSKVHSKKQISNSKIQ